MSRFRTPLLILGLVGAGIVFGAVVLVIRLGRGTPVQLPVAVDEIPAGTPLDPRQFRLEEVRGLEARTVDVYVTADEFGQYVGYPTLEVIHAGFPVGEAQIRTDDPNPGQTRLTLLLSSEEGEEDHLVYPLPVTADQVGNFIVAGDRIDVIFTLGRVAMQELVHVEEWESDVPGFGSPSGAITPTQSTPVLPLPGTIMAYTTTLHLPLAKVILTDVLVLRVEREQIRTASTSYSLSADDGSSQPRMVEGDVLRLYLELSRDQAEVLSFALHNGALNLPARAAPAGGESEGFTWEDFQELFFEGRSSEELRGGR